MPSYDPPYRPRFNEAEVRAKWLHWADREIQGSAAAKRAAADAAVQTLARGGTVDQAVSNARAAARGQQGQGSDFFLNYTRSQARQTHKTGKNVRVIGAILLGFAALVILPSLGKGRGGLSNSPLSGIAFLALIFGAWLFLMSFNATSRARQQTREIERAMGNTDSGRRKERSNSGKVLIAIAIVLGMMWLFRR